MEIKSVAIVTGASQGIGQARSWSEEEMLERRSFLGGLAGASLGVLSEGIVSEFTRAQNTAQAVRRGRSQRRPRFELATHRLTAALFTY